MFCSQLAHQILHALDHNFHVLLMMKGKSLPEQLCWTILRLSELHNPLEILALTHVSIHQQSHILHHWKTTGDVVPSKAAIEQRGRPRHLSIEESFVRFLSIYHMLCFLKLYSLSSSKNLFTVMDVMLFWMKWSKLSKTWLVLLYLRCQSVVDSPWRRFIIPFYFMFFAHINKQLTRNAIEQCAIKWAQYISLIGLQYTSDQLDFVDESSANRRTTYRGYAWAVKGQRATRKAFFVCVDGGTYTLSIHLFHDWTSARYSILPALCSTGILTVDMGEGSYNNSWFWCFIDGLLDQMSPWPQCNSVIVMGNCQIHKNKKVLDMIEARWFTLLSLMNAFLFLLQWDALCVSTTIFTWLQSNRTCIFCNQGICQTQWRYHMHNNVGEGWSWCLCATQWSCMVCYCRRCEGMVLPLWILDSYVQ